MSFVMLASLFLVAESKAFVGGCSDYGYAVYEDINGYCQCNSGYVWGTNYLGEPYCVSGNSYCSDNYGYNSTYNSLNDSCECRSGYELSKTYSGLECKSCYSKYGLHSSFSYLNDSCECDDGYTLKDGNCVEKQNNVYFYLKELDTSNRQIVVKSNYDNNYYLVDYSMFGCYSWSFGDYLNKNIVINLGTDFDLERGDKIVLYDDNETCDIQRVEKVNSSFTLFEEEEEEEPVYFYSNTVPTYQQNINTSPIPNIEKKVENINIDNKQDIPKVCDNDTVLSLDKTYCIKIPENAHKIENSDTDVWLCDSGYTEVSNTCVLDGNNEKTINTTNTQQFSGNIEKYITQKEDSFWWKTLQQFKNFFKKLKFW